MIFCGYSLRLMLFIVSRLLKCIIRLLIDNNGWFMFVFFLLCCFLVLVVGVLWVVSFVDVRLLLVLLNYWVLICCICWNYVLICVILLVKLLLELL